MNATGDFLQFVCGIGQIRRYLGQAVLEGIQLVWHIFSGRASSAQGDQPLLRPIVQIAFQPAPSFIGGRDNPRSGGDQLRTRRAGRDGGGYQVGELSDTLLSVRQQ